MFASVLLRKFSIAQKSAISPIVLILCLGIVVFIGAKALSNIDQELTRINQDLAPDAKLAAEMISYMSALRLQMKNYVAKNSQQAQSSFSETAEQANRLLSQAKQNIQNPERVAILNDIILGKSEYIRIFNTEIVQGIQGQIDLVDNVIDTEGKNARESITQIGTTAYRDGDIEAAFYAGEAQSHLLLARVYAYRFLDENQPQYAERAISELQLTQKALATLLQSLENSERRALVSVSTKSIDMFSDAFTEVVFYAEQISTAVATLDSIGPQITQNASNISSSVFMSLAEQGEEVSASVISTQTVLISAATLAVIIGGGISILVVMGVVAPIKETNLMLKNIAEGDGDLTQRLAVKSEDEIGELAQNFNVFVSKIQTVIGEIVGATQSLSSASNELSVASEQTKNGVEQQEQAIQDVLTHSQELTTTVDAVHRNADVATDQAMDTNKSTQDVSSVVNSAVSSINELVADLNDSNATFERLQGESEKINNVLILITNITEQINLLALNAAIEAARAGDAGRGFAVVADEVRKLAQKTQDSTGEIESLTTSLVEVTQQASASMKSSCDKATATAERSAQAQSSLTDISERVSVISQKNSEIKVATQQQTAAVSEVAEQVELISSVADETKESSLRSTQASQSLAELSQRLESMVGQFRV